MNVNSLVEKFSESLEGKFREDIKEDVTNLYIKAMEIGRIPGYIDGRQGEHEASYGSGIGISRRIIKLENELNALRDKLGIEVI